MAVRPGDAGARRAASARLVATARPLPAPCFRSAGFHSGLTVLLKGRLGEAPEDNQQIAAGLTGPAAASIRGLAYEAAAAGTLDDADRLVESSQYLAETINSYLTALADGQYTISAEQLEHVRENLTAVGDNIAGALDVVDPQRLVAVRDNVNTVIRFVDDYSP